MRYVKSIDVQYSSSTGAISGEDINKGFGGDYVYLRAIYTESPVEAARGFSVFITALEDKCAYDLSKGDGKMDRFVYLQAHYSLQSNQPPITEVKLTEDTPKPGPNQGATIDINKGRGGRYLYLVWTTKS